MPEGADADTQLENIIGKVLRKKGASAAPEVLAASGSSLDIPMSWGVMGIYLRDAITGVGTQSSIERSVGVPPGVLRSFFDEIVAAGYLTRDGDTLRLTPRGRVETDLITTAWRAWLVQELHDWLPATDAEIESGGPAAIGAGRTPTRGRRRRPDRPAPGPLRRAGRRRAGPDRRPAGAGG